MNHLPETIHPRSNTDSFRLESYRFFVKKWGMRRWQWSRKIPGWFSDNRRR